jgi:hypothetical protein
MLSLVTYVQFLKVQAVEQVSLPCLTSLTVQRPYHQMLAALPVPVYVSVVSI